MSVLEKYKLIEKENDEFLLATVDAEPLTTVEDTQENLADLIPSLDLPALHTTEETYKPLTLEEIYEIHNLSNLPVTETIFILENFINALPAELPEFVKKTTVDNILNASSMDLQKLLEDGTTRITHLDDFANEQSAEISQDITSLKQTINKLSTIINQYQQQIKTKELLLEEQSATIHGEIQRVNSIIKFFSA
ncbi:MAG: hypothetical protein ACRC1P_00445 [Cellulosilyticaceae bacterium]